MTRPQAIGETPGVRRHFGEWSGVLKGCLGLAAICPAMGAAPLYGQRTSFDLEGMARRLAAIEEKDPYRLRQLVGEGWPTLILHRPPLQRLPALC